MDAQLLTCLYKFPTQFNICMIPDMRGELDMAFEPTEQEQLLRDTANKAWDAQAKLLEMEVKADQQVIQRTSLGSARLQDLLDWNAMLHRQKQGETCEKLARSFMEHNFPVLKAAEWPHLAGALATARATGRTEKWGPAPGRELLLMIMDLNV
eukprot:7020919-Pyramimonas_sp.AAC.1